MKNHLRISSYEDSKSNLFVGYEKGIKNFVNTPSVASYLITDNLREKLEKRIPQSVKDFLNKVSIIEDDISSCLLYDTAYDLLMTNYTPEVYRILIMCDLSNDVETLISSILKELNFQITERTDGPITNVNKMYEKDGIKIQLITPDTFSHRDFFNTTVIAPVLLTDDERDKYEIEWENANSFETKSYSFNSLDIRKTPELVEKYASLLYSLKLNIYHVLFNWDTNELIFSEEFIRLFEKDYISNDEEDRLAHIIFYDSKYLGDREMKK